MGTQGEHGCSNSLNISYISLDFTPKQTKLLPTVCVSGQVLPAHVPVQRGGGRGAEDGDHRQEEHAHGQEGRHVLLGHVVACHQFPLHVII